MPEGAAVAQWIRLHFPSCRPEFESKHNIYALFNLNFYFEMLKKRK